MGQGRYWLIKCVERKNKNKDFSLDTLKYMGTFLENSR
jgi:hypothetical protein